MRLRWKLSIIFPILFLLLGFLAARIPTPASGYLGIFRTIFIFPLEFFKSIFPCSGGLECIPSLLLWGLLFRIIEILIYGGLGFLIGYFIEKRRA